MLIGIGVYFATMRDIGFLLVTPVLPVRLHVLVSVCAR